MKSTSRVSSTVSISYINRMESNSNKSRWEQKSVGPYVNPYGIELEQKSVEPYVNPVNVQLIE